MDEEKREVLERQGYRIVGGHSGVKLCHWTKASLTKGVGCYKQTFYGIESHRCLQMTPTFDACNLTCQFCWRTQEWGSDSLIEADDPAAIVDGSIEAQRLLLSGFKGNPAVSPERFLEAWHPTNVAISLTGEPTLYKRLGEMIDEFKRRGMSTFLVTNGTTPAALRRMAAEGRLPTQLYVTVAAPNEDVYERLLAARSDHAFRKLKETLALLPSLDTRTVIRHTLVEGWNLGWEDEYAALDATAAPDFIECKGYSFVGESRLRLTADNVPSHGSIRAFAEGLADRLGYAVAAEREDSRVVLLTPDGELHPLPQAAVISPPH
ncbi:MAG: 4-demethylwyosine synthase TYW1 [Methanobacteriota archaeon]